MDLQPQRNCARPQSRKPGQMSDVSEQGSLAYEFLQRNGDSWKIVQDLAIQSDERYSLLFG